MNIKDTPSSQENVRNGSFFRDLKELFKAIVLILNILPVFTGFWLALHFSNESFSDHWVVFLLTITGSTMVMAGALVLNNWYDVDIDKLMARTQKRPTVTGSFSLKTVLILGIVLTVLGFILLFFTTVETTIYAFVGWFIYVILYTMWSKRRYTLNTVIGSVSGAVTPLIGWAAIAPAFHIVPIMLFVILFIWQMPHTFAIAMKKYDEYKAAKVVMLPVVYGFDVTKRQTVVYIACLLPLPFFLVQLGTVFIVTATVLTLAWLVVGFSGFFTKDDAKWAQVMFICSVNYLALLFLMMIVVTLP